MLAGAPDSTDWLLQINPVHPFVFDHPIEHVPPTAPSRPLARPPCSCSENPDALAVRGEFSFLHYIEFDQPCLVRAEVERVSAERATFASSSSRMGGPRESATSSSARAT